MPISWVVHKGEPSPGFSHQATLPDSEIKKVIKSEEPKKDTQPTDKKDAPRQQSKKRKNVKEVEKKTFILKCKIADAMRENDL